MIPGIVRRFLPLAMSLWLIASGAALLPAAEELTEADFRKLHEQLQPPPNELWRTIPWQMSLLDARDLAIKEKKPLVIRVRAGHPLGCV